MSSVDLLTEHCRQVTERLAKGKVIPFLGAGANLCERPEGPWPGRYLPSGAELAAHLADKYTYPDPDTFDLLRVSQFVDLERSEDDLFDDLREIFVREYLPEGDYLPNKLHQFLAALPKLLQARGCTTHGQLIVTTNYDDAVEQAFLGANEDLDVVSYAGGRNELAHFVHIKPSGERVDLTGRDTYREFDLDRRSVLLKIHGAIDRADADGDRYVITEDHYIDYMTRENAVALIPPSLLGRMQRSSFLFLGYGLRDWNLRVILRSIWDDRTRQIQSWAIQRSPSEIDEKLWMRHDVEILGVRLEDWVDAMRAQYR